MTESHLRRLSVTMPGLEDALLDIEAALADPPNLIMTIYEDEVPHAVRAEIRERVLQTREEIRVVRGAERTLAASRGELDLAEKRYAARLSDIVELEDAQRNYTADDAAYANALYGFSVAKAAVDQATARSLSR
jgi:outer membrane protein TolC